MVRTATFRTSDPEYALYDGTTVEVLKDLGDAYDVQAHDKTTFAAGVAELEFHDERGLFKRLLVLIGR